ncbi:MAG: AtpZ/AtpI family protein [Candidatus Calescibacterium sp.]
MKEKEWENIKKLERKSKLEKTAIFIALGFEFLGLVLGGAFLGYIIEKKFKIQEGVGPAIGTLVGLAIALFTTIRILIYIQKPDKKQKTSKINKN